MPEIAREDWKDEMEIYFVSKHYGYSVLETEEDEPVFDNLEEAIACATEVFLETEDQEDQLDCECFFVEVAPGVLGDVGEGNCMIFSKNIGEFLIFRDSKNRLWKARTDEELEKAYRIIEDISG